MWGTVADRPGDRDQMMADTTQVADSKGRLVKRLAVVVVLVIGLFAGLEVILALCGVKPLDFGASEQIPLFVERGESMITAPIQQQIFNPQTFPRRKPTGTFRILCLGGSTTYGRPFDDASSFSAVLRGLLPAIDASQGWEVINAGGIGYDSEALASLLDELRAYEIDLFIIYAGHNELAMMPTRTELTPEPSRSSGLRAIVRRSRTYSMIRRTLDRGKETGGPSVHADRGAAGELGLLIERNAGPTTVKRNDERREQRIGRYRGNLKRMIDAMRSAGGRVLLVAPASNLHFIPFKSEHGRSVANAGRQRFLSLYQQAGKFLNANREDEALARVDEALKIDDEHAHAHYDRGQILWAMGRYKSAHEAFIRARDEDLAGLRATTAIRDVVLRLADAEETHLVDFAEVLARQVPHGTPGQESFLDHVHPTGDGHRRLAVAVVQTLAESGIVQRSAGGAGADFEVLLAEAKRVALVVRKGHVLGRQAAALAITRNYEAARQLAALSLEMDPDDATARLLIEKLNETLQRKDPAFEGGQTQSAEDHLRIAESYQARDKLKRAIHHYREALTMNPDLAVAHRNLGTALMGQGNHEQAIKHFQVAIQIQGEGAELFNNLGAAFASRRRYAEAVGYFQQALLLDPDQGEAHLNIGTALRSQGRIDEAVLHYRRALELVADKDRVHYHWGAALRKQGNLDGAIHQYERAIEINPEHSSSHHSLAMVLVLTGRPKDAVSHFEAAIGIEPEWEAPYFGIAWLLATHPDPEVADASKAIERASQAAAFTNHRHPQILDALAAGYALAGRFEEAVATARRAHELASAAQATAMAEAIKQRITLYEQAKPYRELIGAGKN